MSNPVRSNFRARLAALARVGLRSGVVERAHPASLWTIAKARRRGSLGLPVLFRAHAASRPHQVAVRFEGRSITWSTLDARIDLLASGLERAHGLGRGSTALALLSNRPEALEVQAALGRLGGAAVAASWRSTPDEIAYLARHSGAGAIFVDSALADSLIEAAPELSSIPRENLIGVGEAREGLTSYEQILERGEGAEPPDESEGAVIIYTSGTTGKPKGAVRRFPDSMLWALVHMLDELPLRADDRHLAVCPMYHTTAFGFIGFTMVLGGQVVICPRFEPEGFLALVERERITTTAVVPTMLHRLLALPAETRRRYDTSSLRVVVSAGAPLGGDLARRVIDELGMVLYNVYGSTEAGLNTLATPEELLRAPGTIGHVVGGNEIKLLDEAGREVPDGETGELWVRNDMLIAGYHEDEAATRDAMREGFFSVGDLAHRDADGLVHIDGRKRDMIVSGGLNIYPAEVEAALESHPAVSEVAVVGVPDEEWGERVIAFVVPAEGDLDVDAFLAHARARLAGPKVPREVRLLDRLPRNPTGKVLKRELRAT